MNRNLAARPNTLQKAVVATSIAILGLTACGRNTDAGGAKINTCNVTDTKSPFGKAVEASPIETASALLSTVQRQVATLHERAIATDGRIQLDVHKGFTEIKANQHQLMLQFPGDDQGYDIGFRHLYFHERPDGTFGIALGAVACNDNGTLYPNQVTTALTQYVNMTAHLDSIKS